jgi:hypothetical protein
MAHIEGYRRLKGPLVTPDPYEAHAKYVEKSIASLVLRLC